MKWAGLSIVLRWTKQQMSIVHLNKRRLLSLAWSQQLTRGVTIYSIVFPWFQLKKCVAWVLRYKSRLWRAINKRKRNNGCHSCWENWTSWRFGNWRRQESYYKATQSAHFHNELTSLSSLQKFVKKSKGIFKSDSILVDGIIRVGGHLSNSEIEPDAKHLV